MSHKSPDWPSTIPEMRNALAGKNTQNGCHLFIGIEVNAELAVGFHHRQSELTQLFNAAQPQRHKELELGQACRTQFVQGPPPMTTGCPSGKSSSFSLWDISHMTSR